MKAILRWASPAAAAAVLAAVIWHLGSGPFVEGVRALDGRALVAAAAIFLITTVCAAWRWKIVAEGLGVRLSLPDAVAGYYRALFLNLTLPGGVAGDVHRGVSHGRDVRDIGHALRAVVWERTAGQAIQVLLTISVLFVLPSPLRSSMPFVALALAVTVMVVVSLSACERDAEVPDGSSCRTRRWPTFATVCFAGVRYRRSCWHRSLPSLATCSRS